MDRFFVTFEASAAYTTNAPTIEVLLNGALVSSGLITQHTGSGTTLLSFGLDFPSLSGYPSSLSFRFNDAYSESRTVTVANIAINGQPVDTTYISMLSLTKGQSAALSTALIDHLFGRVEPALADFGTPDIVGSGSGETLHGSDGRDVIDAGGGDDRIIAGPDGNVASGGDGNDTIIGGAGNDLLTGDDGNDTIIGNAGDDLIYGGAGQDSLIGGGGNDVINGGDGNDSLLGDAGNDVLYGEDGNDKLLGGAGDDWMYGDAGTDWMEGSGGNDTMYGGADNDLLSGGGGNDTIYGEDGDDDIDAGAGNDIVDGGAGVDRISGSTGDDTLSGGDGNDYIMGDAGNDTLNGDANDDALLGGAGADILNGGSGNDRLYGSALSLIDASVAVLGNANTSFNMSTNSFYRYVSGAVDYATASAAAESAMIVIGGVTYYGHLVTVTSAVENVFAHDLAGSAAIWIGASDAKNEGQWLWQGGMEDGLNFSSGSAAQNNFFTNWAVGEPNGSGDVAVMDTDGNWYDRADTEVHGYVIEWDGINIADDGAMDTLSGGTGNDILLGGAGNDVLNGGDNNDQLFGGAGNDTLNGDNNDDFLLDYEGTNSFNGGAGNDILDSRYHGDGTAPAVGVQTMYGGAGNDWLYGNSGADLLYGEGDDDFINGYDGNDTIDGGSGADIIYGGAGGDTINGGDGNDTIYAVQPVVTLITTSFNSGTESFTYTDGVFGSSGSSNNYATGTRTTTDGLGGNGALQVTLGGVNNTAATNISGGWVHNFTATDEVENTVLTFQYHVVRQGTFETNEDTYVYVELDGTRYGLNGNNYISTFESDGGDPATDTGWVSVSIDIGTLSSGAHTLTVGGYNEGKDNSNEYVDIRFDNIVMASEVASDDSYSNVINGGNNNDVIYGSAGTDTLNGGAGNDTIYSRSTPNINVAAVLANYAGVSYNATTGSFYQYVTTGQTWENANSAANAAEIYGVHGHLVQINSATENSYVDTISGTANFWVGASDGAVNGEWRWIGGPDNGVLFWLGQTDGTAINGAYTNWNPGEPNDYNGYEANLEFYNGGLWNDQLPGNTRAYIIEWEAWQILSSGNPTHLNGGTGVDNLYGYDGTDIFEFDNMANIDVIHDFDRADGDAIDVSDILTGYDAADHIADFVLISDGTATDSYEALMENYKPLLYYRLNDQSGTTATDNMGVQNGTYVNTPGLANNTDFNGALSNDSVNFNGTNEFVRVTDHSRFDMTAGTFMAWFRSDTTTGTDQTVFAKEGTGSGGRFHLAVDTQSGNVVGAVSLNGSTYNINVDPTSVLGDDINTNTWYHMAFTFGTGGATLYINGEAVWSNNNFTQIGSNRDFIIGGNNENGNNNNQINEFFNGLIDEVTVFNQKLSAQSVANIYHAGLNATNGTFADGVYVNSDGQNGDYTQVADFSGTTNILDNSYDMLANGNLTAL